MMIAKINPFNNPTIASRLMTRHAFADVKSFVASARTATVKVCVPALPPIEATIGIKTARATIASIVDEN